MSLYANSEYRVGDMVRDAEGAILFRTGRVLRDARRILVSRGWQRGNNPRGTGPCCALNALSRAARYDDTAMLRAEILLKMATGEDWIAKWNDRQSSAEPVLAAFDRAIQLAEVRA
jgi:hypothetical protein